MKAERALKCPANGCGAWCQRISGCNKVICARCQEWICFGCGEKWDAETARTNRYAYSPHMKCKVKRDYEN